MFSLLRYNVSLFQLSFNYSFRNQIVYSSDVLEVKPESEPVAPNAQEEENAQRKEKSDGHIQALAVEGPGVCARVDDWVFVDVHDYHIVATVMKLLNECLKPVTELCRMFVLSWTKENVDVVGNAT